MRAALLLLVWALAAMAPTRADAALPPFELVQKSIAQNRGAQNRVPLNLRITETGATLTEWKLTGIFSPGEVPKRLGPKAALPLRLLWIATLCDDPIGNLQKTFGLVDTNTSTVGVQDGFVYVYGTLPAVSVYRDLKRLAAFSIQSGGKRWVTRLAWNEGELTGLMISRDGKTVLTARAIGAR